MNNQDIIIDGVLFCNSDRYAEIFKAEYPEKAKELGAMFYACLLGFMQAKNDYMLHFLHRQQKEIQFLKETIKRYEELEKIQSDVHLTN